MIEISPAELKLLSLAKRESRLQATTLNESLARSIISLSIHYDDSQLFNVLKDAKNYIIVENHLSLVVEATNWNNTHEFDFIVMPEELPILRDKVTLSKFNDLGWSKAIDKSIKTIVEIESNRIYFKEIGIYYNVTNDGKIYGRGITNPITVEEWIDTAPNIPTKRLRERSKIHHTEILLNYMFIRDMKLRQLNPVTYEDYK